MPLLIASLLLPSCIGLYPSITAESSTVESGVDSDTLPRDTSQAETEEVPGPDPLALPPMCSMTLTCPAIPDEPKVACNFQLTDGYGRIEYDGRAGVELHGRSSQAFPKPQYSLELWDASDLPTQANLLGQGRESDWILNGAYIDRALMRNWLAFDLYQRMGGWAPDSHPCTLTLNDTWMGIYFLTERPKRDDDRIDIAADDGTGASFVLKLDDDTGITGNTYGYGYWKLVYPTSAEATGAQVAGILEVLGQFDAAIAASNYGAIADLVDLDNLADFLLLEESLKNNDAYFLSVYMWRDGGGKLHFTPWDLDLCLGQPSYNDNELTTGWILYRPTFIANMAAHPMVRERLVERWTGLRAGDFADEAFLARMDAYRAIMQSEIEANFKVWPIETIQFGGSYLYPVTSYDDEYTKVQNWAPERFAWVDANIAAY